MLGHNWIDVLKIDVEGSEYEAFAAIAAMPGGLPFTQLQVCGYQLMLLTVLAVRARALEPAQY